MHGSISRKLTILTALSAGVAPAAAEPVPSADAVRELLRCDDWSGALAAARRARAATPADPDVLAALGEALFRAGRLEETGELLAPLAAGDSAPARALMTLARLRDAEGREREAIELMARAVAAAPADRDLLFRASEASSGRAEAVARLERYLELSEGDDPDRIESARGTIRLFRALGERPVWVDRTRPERFDLPLRRVWDVDSGRTTGFVVQARLGGERKPVPLLLDSGSPGLMVLQRVARKRGFETLADRTTFGGGGAKRHSVRRGFFPRVRLGGLEFADALASASPHELDPTGRYRGILGLSVFHGYRIVLDLRRGRMELSPARPMDDGSPYWVVAGQMLVRARIGASADGLFLFDTGATRTMLDAEVARGIAGARLGAPARIRGFGGDLQGASALHGVEVSFQDRDTAGAVLRAVDLSLRSRLAGLQVAGFVGLDLLADTRIEIDTVARRLRIVAGD